MTQRHTPGPWSTDKQGLEVFSISGDNEDVVCTMTFPFNMHDDRLISAAIELLDVAKLLKAACGIQYNLLSTATEAQKNEFISIVYSIYNDVAASALEKAGVA